jgi:hypothetical protein
MRRVALLAAIQPTTLTDVAAALAERLVGEVVASGQSALSGRPTR